MIPGSHRVGEKYTELIHGGLQAKGNPGSLAQWGVGGASVPAMVLETMPGDVVAFNQATKHSAWGGGGRRRMFTINYTRNPRNAAEKDVYKSVCGYTRADCFGGGYSNALGASIAGQPLLMSGAAERRRHLSLLLECVHPNPEKVEATTDTSTTNSQKPKL